MPADITSSKQKKEQERQEAREALSALAKTPLAREAKEVLSAYAVAKEAEKMLEEARTKLHAAAQTYHLARRDLAVKLWSEKGLGWCSYKDHLAPLEEIELVQVVELELSGNRYYPRLNKFHRTCDACRQSISSQGAVPLDASGSIRMPDSRLLIYDAEIREDGVYACRGSEWEKSEHSHPPDTAPSYLETLVSGEENFPKPIVMWFAGTDKDSLKVGKVPIPEEVLS